ncbi:histidinol-phosphatase HisJ [Longirhabdus pacifica]|uniref:histidinol-phosphatase HisJ n=1 Tax=Longirhabdus pacifica TaxID=2305227 RepID=UPI0010091430|nr:histidinol-phosphatase HisJ [Longirhabdus pacifica]
MFVDYHTHHERCGHAEGTLEQYIQKGIEIGLEQIGLSDHMPLLHVDPANYYPEMAMSFEDLPYYVEECLQLKEKYAKQIDIKVGLEADYIEGYEEQISAIIQQYPWDYVIGSVHFIGEWDITDYRQTHEWNGKNIDSIYETYYKLLQQAAATEMYDIIGHFDVIKRFGYKPEMDTKELENQTLHVVKKHDIALECNTSGLRMPAKEMFPSERILRYASQLGIPITLSSDAHKPNQLAYALKDAQKLLKTAGFQQIATFQARKRILSDFNCEQ